MKNEEKSFQQVTSSICKGPKEEEIFMFPRESVWYVLGTGKRSGWLKDSVPGEKALMRLER